MTAKSSFIDSRTIRVFISSTFQDMQDERTELIRRTFPRLREMAAQRDVTLTEVDLRWGITNEESESGKVMEICLREVENSIPFFIGIIGNRYGWVPEPEDISDIVKERFRDVPKYVERHLSATEIEMQFGVLDRTDVDMNAFFFIKEDETSDIDDPERLAALKKAVRENKKYPVSSYTTPEDLADQVLAAFTKLLDDLFPVGELSALDKERLGQRAVLNNLSRVYIKTESNFAVIDKWMEDWEKHQLVITGASGLGKSALVANWIKEKLKLGEELPYRIIYHFVGYGGSVGSDWHVVKALCDEIRDRYGFEADEREPKTDEKALDDLFKRVAVEGDKPLLIVLDGINQIIDVNYAKRLNWLPIPPRKVKILFTTLEEDGTMEVFRDRHYPIFTLQPLTRDERIAMVRRYLDKTYRKHLEDAQLERIVDDPQNENTLVLKTLLDEIANFGSFEKLDEKIEEYLKPDSISDFYQVVLQNYEADFGEELVRHFLSLIAVSRNGLSEDEILEITDTKDKPILWSQFFCSFRQHMVVKNGLVSFAHSYIREAVEERYINGRDEWARSCREEIVAILENQKTPEGKKTTRSMDEVPYQLDLLEDFERLHSYLLDLEVFSYLYKKEEIALGGFWRKLVDTGRYKLEDYLDEADKSKHTATLKELGMFSRTTLVNPSLSIHCLESALSYTKKVDIKRAEILNNIGLSYAELYNDSNKAITYHLRALEIGEKILGERHQNIAIYHCNIGAAYSDCGEYEMSFEHLDKAAQILKSLYGVLNDSLATTYNNIAINYLTQADDQEGEKGSPKVFQEALQFSKMALEIQMRLFGETHRDVAQSYSTLGGVYGYLHKQRKEIECYLKALRISINLFGENHPNVATLYSNIGITYGEQHNHKKALEYELAALRIRRYLYDETNSDVATSYDNIGKTYDELNNYEKALEFKLEALRIRLKLYDGENHPDVVESYSSIGETYGEMGNHQKESEYRRKALHLTAVLLNRLAESYKTDGQLENANEYFRRAADAFKELGDFKMMKKNLNQIK